MATTFTDKQIEEAYRIARIIAKRFCATHFIAHLDVEDYVQEGVLGWLEGRNIYHAIIDAFRNAAPIDKMMYKPGMHIPEMVHYGVHVPESIGKAISYDPTNAMEDFIDSRDMIDKILDFTHQLPEKVQFCVLGSYYYGLTLADIAEIMGVNIRFVSEWRKEGVECLKKHFNEKEKEKDNA